MIPEPLLAPGPVLASLLAGIAMERGICRPSAVVDALCFEENLKACGVASEDLVRLLLERGSITAAGASRLLAVAEAEIRRLALPGLGDLVLVRHDPKTLLFQGAEPPGGREVLVRLLRLTLSERPEQVNRFVLARRGLMSLAQRGVGTYLRGGDVEGVPYAVLAPPPRPDLGSRVAGSGPLPLREVLGLLRRLAGELRVAHGCGILHGALDPRAVACPPGRPPGLGEFPVLDGPRPATGAADAFRAPEVRADPGSRDELADVYGLGAVGYYALTGRAPPPDPGAGPEVPEPIARMLDPEAARRPVSMDEVIAGLPL